MPTHVPALQLHGAELSSSIVLRVEPADSNYKQHNKLGQDGHANNKAVATESKTTTGSDQPSFENPAVARGDGNGEGDGDDLDEFFASF